MSNRASDVLKVAKSQVGNGNAKYNKWYGNNINTAWCGTFVLWCFTKAKATGYMPKDINPAYVPNIDNYAKAHGMRIADKVKAKPGDVVIFDWRQNGTRDHVGLIYKNNGSSVTTIEGNTGAYPGHVYMRTRYWSDIYSIIRPNYDKAKVTKTTKKTKYKTTTVMRVRKSATTKSDTLKLVSAGAVVYASKVKGNWAYIPSLKGWICIKDSKHTYLKKCQ